MGGSWLYNNTDEQAWIGYSGLSGTYFVGSICAFTSYIPLLSEVQAVQLANNNKLAAGNIYLSSTETVCSTAPVEANMIIEANFIDTVTLNTDLNAYCSRDNGTTWVQTTLSQQVYLQSGSVILSGEASFSSVPTGTNLVWKITSANSKNLQILAVSQ